MKETLKRMKYCDTIYLTGIKHALVVKSLLDDGLAEIVNAKWLDRLKVGRADIYPLDLSNHDRWRTYEKCADVYLEFEKEKIVCKITIYDGDNMYGDRTYARWKGIFNIKHSDIGAFKDSIDSHARRRAHAEYQDKLNKTESAWIENRLKNLTI